MKYVILAGVVLLCWRVNFAQSPQNRVPYFKTKAITRVSIDSTYRYSFAAADSDDLTLTYSILEIPAWIKYSESSHTLSGKPLHAGQFPVHLQTTNGKNSANQYFVITVWDAATTNILCIGNSITNGTGVYNSYRLPLWELLYYNKYDFDFIGSWDRHHWGGDVPNPEFDLDHEGHSGWTAEHILNPPDWDNKRGNIHSWLKIYTPDIAIIELGTNDVFQCRTAEDLKKSLAELIGAMRNKNPRVKIVVANVLPLGKQWSKQNLCKSETYGKLVLKMNEMLLAFVPGQSTKQSPATLVDIFTGIDPSIHMYDDIHPNTEGEKILAEKFYAAISPYLKQIKP